ncbi:hypothetical protein ABFY59_26215 [Priestia aryabhattai]|uniref:hypothetical protein n=1 Tax=Priestia aryabhattai TaxID=412384 RepID=UPI003D2E9159
MKKKLFGYIMASGLTLGVMAAANSTAFAASKNETGSSTVVERTNGITTNTDDATQQKVDDIMKKAQEKLQKLGVSLPQHKEGPFSNLGAATKEKAKAIMDQLRDGTLTKEQAEAKLKELGVNFPEHKGGPFSNLDAATKKKAKAIMDQLRDGTLTKEQAEAKLKELGVQLPAKKKDFLNGLDAETKAKAETILENAKKEIQKLGVTIPFEKNEHKAQ